MRYWIITAAIVVLYYIVMSAAAPDSIGSVMFYIGNIACCVLARAITWNDEDPRGDKVVMRILACAPPIAGIALTLYGVAYKLGFIADKSDGLFVSTAEAQLASLSLACGLILILATGCFWFRRYLSHQ
ncbi:hypothetical protein CTO56_18160 [Salmonella enterica]|nr:hypothetical protein [Salmonella enterica]